jgi:hypothetical protein
MLSMGDLRFSEFRHADYRLSRMGLCSQVEAYRRCGVEHYALLCWVDEPCRCGQCVPPKLWQSFVGLHGVTLQKTGNPESNL